MSLVMLIGHTSRETAFQQQDYPYSFRLRCQRLAWLEYKATHGYRFVTMTSNPKRPGLVWNTPKASTYAPLAVMFLDEKGHVEWDALHTYAELAKVEQFATAYGDALQGEREATILAGIRKIAVVEHERSQVQARLRELASQPRQGEGAVIQHARLSRLHPEKGPDPVVGFLSEGYAFWSMQEDRAYVFPDATEAAALIAAYPLALKGATVLVRQGEGATA